MRYIISGGGTGGHIYPAIAIANAIKRKQADAEILFVGAEGKMEMDRVPKAGYPIKGLPVRGFQRKLTMENLTFPFKLMKSLLKARKIIKQFKPDVVIGTGGYASGPTLRMAKGVATVLQEQNSYAGVTNKLLAQKADKICVAYDNMGRYFPEDKIELTGNPVRQDILDLTGKRSEGIQHYGLDANKKTILIIGGSLGARTLNQSLNASNLVLAHREDIQVLWQCGKFYWEAYKDCDTAQLPHVKITQFIDRMDLAYAMADIVISRAGAISISELCLVQKPVVLVPSPNVAEDHQTKNAMALVEKDAAVMIADSKAKETLVSETLALLEDVHKCQTLANNIAKLGKPHSADHIADVIIELANKAK